MGIQTFYLRNDELVEEPNGKGALMYVHDHQAQIERMRAALTRSDSLLSLLFYRYSNSIRSLVGEDCFHDIDGAITQARAALGEE